MSLCENHGEGKNGKIMSFYATVKSDRGKWSRRLKLCGVCIDGMRMTFSDQWSDGFILSKTPEHPTCVGCGSVAEPEERLAQFFGTGYSKNDQRHDYSAYYCNECASSVISQFRLEEVRNGAG